MVLIHQTTSFKIISKTYNRTLKEIESHPSKNSRQSSKNSNRNLTAHNKSSPLNSTHHKMTIWNVSDLPLRICSRCAPTDLVKGPILALSRALRIWGNSWSSSTKGQCLQGILKNKYTRAKAASSSKTCRWISFLLGSSPVCRNKITLICWALTATQWYSTQYKMIIDILCVAARWKNIY